MPEIFDATERAVLAALADVMIPSGASFLSASAAGVSGDGLDQVLAVRPELAKGLKQILQSARGRAAAEVVAELQANDPGTFAVLAEIVPGAYFLNPNVRTAIGYAGQIAHPIDSNSDCPDGLLQSVIDRGPIYRPTKGQGDRPAREGVA
jgi:hypothetical protein